MSHRTGFDNFIGWVPQAKKDMLLGVQQARLTGQIVRVETARGVFTEFNISQTNVNQVLRELELSIAEDCNIPDTDPIKIACRKNQRAGITRPVFTL